MCPMPGDDVTPAVVPGPRPSHHSGPSYVANAKAPDFELDEPLREAEQDAAAADYTQSALEWIAGASWPTRRRPGR